MSRAVAFTFGSYAVDIDRSIVSCTYHVDFANGKRASYTDRLYLPGVTSEQWERVPREVLTPTLEALLLMLGINYWAVFPVRTIRIEGFSLTREQAHFWNTMYEQGLGEYFYAMRMDFRGLIAFPYDDSRSEPVPTALPLPACALLLHGAGKDSILSAEMLKEAGADFDFFAFSPSRAHERIARLVGAHTIHVTRTRDSRMRRAAALRGTSAAYPSVSTFTFVATLIAELCGYDSIVFSNERSADTGNLTYLGMVINHQWCKSSEAERMVNQYIQRYITPSIRTYSLLRSFSELEIVRRFVRYPQYLRAVTSCNGYFCHSRFEQLFLRTPYWCNICPKCVFLFACFAAFLPKKEVVAIFGANAYARPWNLSLIRRMLGVQGFKPLDCVGEPEEMIVAMQYAAKGGEYNRTPALRFFTAHAARWGDLSKLEERVFSVQSQNTPEV